MGRFVTKVLTTCGEASHRTSPSVQRQGLSKRRIHFGWLVGWALWIGKSFSTHLRLTVVMEMLIFFSASYTLQHLRAPRPQFGCFPSLPSFLNDRSGLFCLLALCFSFLLRSFLFLHYTQLFNFLCVFTRQQQQQRHHHRYNEHEPSLGKPVPMCVFV